MRQGYIPDFYGSEEVGGHVSDEKMLLEETSVGGRLGDTNSDV